MIYSDLLAIAPALETYARSVPAEIDSHFSLQRFPPHATIHSKDDTLTRIGILLRGTFRVLNEFENGNIFMIETNEAVSFIGEVTLLAEADTTSVTIEAVSECLIAFLPVSDFDRWLRSDIVFLRRVSTHVAKKLYCSSYNRGERLFYSPGYLLLKYLLQAAKAPGPEGRFVLKKTRSLLSEEMGMTVKTLNRTISTLRDDGLLSIQQGKIALSDRQYELCRRRLSFYMQQRKNGSNESEIQ